jgi:hypothetical protein
MSATLSQMMIDRMNQRMLERRLAAKRTGRPVDPRSTMTGVPKPAADTNAAVRFKSTGTRIKVVPIVREFGGPPAQQEQLRTMVTGILDGWDRETAAGGMKNDLALAFAAFTAFSVAAYRGQPLPPDDKLLELRNLFAEAMVASGNLGSITDRQKQEMHEILIIFGTLAYSGWSEAVRTGDAASADAFKKLGAANLQTVLGIKPDDISIGPEGLNFRGPGAVPGDPAPNASGPGDVIHAGQLVADFEANEVAANMKYAGKRTRVVGRVNSIDIESDGRTSLTFRSTITSYGMAKCYFDGSQHVKLSLLKGNDEVMVIGSVRGLGGGWAGAKAYVLLEKCEVQ